jgi:hypothetical protein
MRGRAAKADGVKDIVCLEATMGADLDTLCTRMYCRGDDLLPERRKNARRWTTYAEIVTPAVAQVLMGLPSGRRFLRATRRQIGHRMALRSVLLEGPRSERRPSAP